MADLKMQHLIVMVALLVSLVGTLLILGKMNTDASPITGATAVIDITAENIGGEEQQTETAEQEEGYGTVVRVVGANQTEPK